MHGVAAVGAMAVLSSIPSGAQAPVPSPDSVVNAASFVAGGPPHYGLAPGGLAVIFGRNLASGTAQSQSVPYPEELLGTSLTVAGRRAGLLYVSPGQINFRIPVAFDSIPPEQIGMQPLPLIVTTPAGSSRPVDVAVHSLGLGIFTLDGSGCGAAFAYNARGLITGDNSAEPGGVLTLLGTGLGLPDRDRVFAVPYIGEQIPEGGRPERFTFREAGVAEYAGPADGLPGLERVDIRLSPSAPEGCNLPLWVNRGFTSSQAIPVSIRRGGGRCADPTQPATAYIRWRKVVSSGFSNPPDSEQLDVEFSRSRLPERTLVSGAAQILPALALPPSGPRCPVLDQQKEWFDAGRLTVQASGYEASAEPRPGQGEQTYTLKLPPGTIRSGSFQVRAAGSSQAGPFTSAIEIPEPIRITTNLAPGTEIPVAPVTLIARLTVNWEGGDATSRVMVVARVSGFAARLGGPAILSRSVPASAGTCILEGIPVFPGGAFEAGVWHYREEASAAPFTVERLGSPGWHGWRYEFRFAGLKAAIPPGPPGRD